METIRISWYGICLVLGASFGAAVCLTDRKEILEQKKIRRVDLVCCYLFVLLGMGMGAKLLYLILHPGLLRVESYLDVLQILLSGFSYYGAIFGGIAACAIACYGFRLPFGTVIQSLIPGYPAIYAVAKIGCGIRGCCYGIIYQGRFALISPSGTECFPVQFLDAAVSFGITFFLWNRKRKQKDVFWEFLILHAAERFLLEFLRAGTAKTMIGLLSVTQVISLGVLGIWVIVSCKKIVLQRREHHA